MLLSFRISTLLCTTRVLKRFRFFSFSSQIPPEDYPDIRLQIRNVCKKFEPSYWRHLDKERKYPELFVQELTKGGWLACLIPEEYGGSGLGLKEASVILEEINYSGANGAACHAQMYIMGSLLKHGNEQQKKKYLPKIATGELRLQAFGVTEPDAGSNTTQITTTAKKETNGYILNGSKIFTSRAEFSDLMLILARTTPVQNCRKKTDGLSLFLIDLKKSENSGGSVRIDPIHTMINHSTTQIFFSDFYIPKENLVGTEGHGFLYLLDGFNAERILIASECLGDSFWFLEKARNYGNSRIVFNIPVGKNQGIQFPLSQVYAQVRAAELMRNKAADLFDRGLPCGEESNIAKLLASQASWQAANATMDTFGGYGFCSEFDVERKFRETRLYLTAPVSNNMVLCYIGEHVLKLPRSF